MSEIIKEKLISLTKLGNELLDDDIKVYITKDKLNTPWLDYYNDISDSYDYYNHLTFELQNQNENEVRSYVIDKLDIKENETILEIGCGTGRDSELIINRLSKGNKYYLLDSSEAMLKICYDKIKSSNKDVTKKFVISDMDNLPFKDNTFDKVFSFVSINASKNMYKVIAEIVRVSKPGALVLIGNEGILPNLQQKEFGQKMINNSSLYSNVLDISRLPGCVHKLKLEWILNDIIYLLSFNILKEERKTKFDMLIPGNRGGSINTRFYGKLEGVSLETKLKFIEFSKKSTKSRKELLEEIILKALK